MLRAKSLELRRFGPRLGPVSKTGMGGFVHRGFESLPLRCLGVEAPGALDIVGDDEVGQDQFLVDVAHWLRLVRGRCCQHLQLQVARVGAL